MKCCQIRPEESVQAHAQPTKHSLGDHSQKSNDPKPAERAPRPCKPRSDGQRDGRGADDVPGQPMRVFNDEARARLLPVDEQQVPGVSRPERIGHADAERGDKAANHEQQGGRDNTEDRPDVNPTGNGPTR